MGLRATLGFRTKPPSPRPRVRLSISLRSSSRSDLPPSISLSRLRHKEQDEIPREGTQERDLFARRCGQTLKQQLGCHFLEVEFYRLWLSPPSPPGNELDILTFEVQVRSSASAKDSGRSPTLVQSVWHLQARHDCVPLGSVNVKRSAKQPVLKRAVEVQLFKKRPTKVGLQDGSADVWQIWPF